MALVSRALEPILLLALEPILLASLCSEAPTTLRLRALGLVVLIETWGSKILSQLPMSVWMYMLYVCVFVCFGALCAITQGPTDSGSADSEPY